MIRTNLNIKATINDQDQPLSIGKIRSTKQLDLVLLNYWNLYESLMYSESTIPVFWTWHEQGVGKLQELILKLGIPLQQAQQKFQYLNPSYRKDLLNKILFLSDKFHLQNIAVNCFQYQIDNRHLYNSNDLVFCFNKVLNSS